MNDQERIEQATHAAYAHAQLVSAGVAQMQIAKREPGYIHGFMLALSFEMTLATRNTEAIASILEDCALRLRTVDPITPGDRKHAH